VSWDTAPAESEARIDMKRLRAYRLGRVREQLVRLDYAAAVLFDPINIRYASGTSNMQIWTQHSPDRYLFVPAEGPVVLFDGYVLGTSIEIPETVQDVRPATTWFFEAKGPRVQDSAVLWADEIADLVRRHGGGNRRLAIDRLGPAGFAPLIGHGLVLFDAQEPLELARAIKSPEEIACMGHAIAVCETGMARMAEALEPGISENALWSLLVQAVFEQGGESMETRLLASGPRTNPTDLIGPYGMCVDISRTYHCGPGEPSDEQRRLYEAAYRQIQYNVALLAAGMSFREYAEKSWRHPEEFLANRYICLAHGVGLADEYPDILHPLDWQASGYDGVIQENMVLSVESYIGTEGGGQGVKLEEQVLVTRDGPKVLSTYPFEAALLG
jgi:Xaa-Pro aminopeptidase